MATIVGVLDRDERGANTDILVRVDRKRKALLWVPRDLWCPSLGNRINRAWAVGGADLLSAALSEHGLPVEHHLVVTRPSAEACLDRVDVEVPVVRFDEYWYPLDPTKPIKAGRQRVAFAPPSTRLRGERVHQWIGARKRLDGTGSDLDRIERQQTLLRELLWQRFDFSPALAGADASESATSELVSVGFEWEMATLSGLRPGLVGGKAVLVREGGL